MIARSYRTRVVGWPSHIVVGVCIGSGLEPTAIMSAGRPILPRRPRLPLFYNGCWPNILRRVVETAHVIYMRKPPSGSCPKHLSGPRHAPATHQMIAPAD